MMPPDKTVQVYVTERRGRLHVCWRQDGRVRYKSCRTDDPTEAEIQRREKEQELREHGEDPFERHRNRPLTDHLEDYLQDMRADGTSEKHIGMVRQRIERVLEATGMRYIRDLSPSPIKRAVALFRRCPQRKNGNAAEQPLLSARSRNFYLQAMRQFARWLVADVRMPFNPLTSLKNWSVQADLRHERDRLSPEEFAKLVRAAEKSTAVIEGVDGRTRALLYQLAYGTGLRRKELASLTPQSFKLTRRRPTVTVRAAHTKNGEQAVLRLHSDLVKLVAKWLEEHDLAADEPLFPGLAGKKTNRMIQRDLKDAGVPYRDEEGRYRDFHSLRHAFISSVWEAGATPPVAQRLARHSDIRLTMKYSHTDPAAEDAVIRKMSGLPGKRNGKRKGKGNGKAS